MYFEDLSIGRTASVHIAQECSGIFSLGIFVSAFFAFVISGLLAFLLGLIWYHPKVMGDQWAEARGINAKELKLKKGCPLMIIRNINTRKGLCNGTRVIYQSTLKGRLN